MLEDDPVGSLRRGGASTCTPSQLKDGVLNIDLSTSLVVYMIPKCSQAAHEVDKRDKKLPIIHTCPPSELARRHHEQVFLQQSLKHKLALGPSTQNRALGSHGRSSTKHTNDSINCHRHEPDLEGLL